jgi:hypothetical protein
MENIFEIEELKAVDLHLSVDIAQRQMAMRVHVAQN